MFGIEPLVPTYGRDYKSLKTVQLDWDNNKDFKMNDGRYINKQDAIKFGVNGKTELLVRYNKLFKTGKIKV
jgi:hypothetical protein